MNREIRNSIFGLSEGGSHAGISWQTYWSHQSEVLFFGLYSEIADGKMPNKVIGATDYLTVAGVAGSETYQCPNTAAYIAADTDYIWFKTDETQRTTTTAELIGYDLQRTPIYYLDDAPNSIIAIMILKSGETLSVTKIDKLHKDFHLPIMWDNAWNDNGREKSNRSDTEQILWTPEPVIPECLGTNIIWGDYLEKVSKDGGGNISAWGDVLNNGNSFVLEAGTPQWDETDGILLGNGNTLKITFASQKVTIYLVIKPKTWNNLARHFDGLVDGENQFYQFGTTPNVAVGSVSGWSAAQALSLNSWHIVRIKFNGTSSKWEIDNNGVLSYTGTSYSTNTGLILGGRFNSSGASTLSLKEIIVRPSASESDDNWDAIKLFLKNKHKL